MKKKPTSKKKPAYLERVKFDPKNAPRNAVEAGIELGMSSAQITHHIEEGTLEAINIASAHATKAYWRVPIEAIAAFKAKRSSLRTGT